MRNIGRKIIMKLWCVIRLEVHYKMDETGVLLHRLYLSSSFSFFRINFGLISISKTISAYNRIESEWSFLQGIFSNDEYLICAIVRTRKETRVSFSDLRCVLSVWYYPECEHDNHFTFFIRVFNPRRHICICIYIYTHTHTHTHTTAVKSISHCYM